MFLDILEFVLENKQFFVGKTVFKMWSQKLTKITCFVPIIRQRLGTLFDVAILTFEHKYSCDL